MDKKIITLNPNNTTGYFVQVLLSAKSVDYGSFDTYVEPPPATPPTYGYGNNLAEDVPIGILNLL